jgi:hypothetical protein
MGASFNQYLSSLNTAHLCRVPRHSLHHELCSLVEQEARASGFIDTQEVAGREAPDRVRLASIES